MFQFLSKYKIQILISFTAGLILLIIKPILFGIGELLTEFLISFSKSFSEYYFRLISTMDNHLTDELILFLIILFITVFIVNLMVDMSIQLSNYEDQKQQYIDELEETKRKWQQYKQTENFKSKLEIDIESDTKKLKAKIEELEEGVVVNTQNAIDQIKNLSYDKFAKSLILLKIVGSFSVLVLFLNSLVYSMANSENSKFRRELIILRSEINNDSTIYDLQSRWVQMKNETDYKVIYSIIDELRTSNDSRKTE